MKIKTGVILVISTVPESHAHKIAKKLLHAKLASCINLIPGIISYYFWKNKLEHANEIQMLIKCKRINQKTLIKLLKEIHPYEIPEILVIPISYIDDAYLSWLSI
ncbi:divalent-cation tolerance protein CutA [Candidatus Pantoea edessiphila]|uniref:Divalent-cation tolerance protein CutA n=1 Tax=Candidatus Pantoea edessiphila TaxID=2044610 RepID=A0A2P5T1Z6_9GAMM|nr:divalent-cation tolerance protein CutA [Candidatus Pantoea edessiphila]PPI88586.1 divalent-cation tolerance protein CutA [Candidatus Pantoea edessiphila]